jgi:hypothetical protein
VVSWWNKIRALSRLEWLVFFQSLLLLPWCALRLRADGFRSFYATTRNVSLPPQHVSSPEHLAVARSVARGVSLAARYGPYRANCLKRSLVLVDLLRERGIECELKMGTELVDQELAAHAWVEHAGVVLNDHRHVGRRFSVFVSSDRERNRHLG